MEKGLILNTSYNDFILGTNVSDYFDKRYEEGGVAGGTESITSFINDILERIDRNGDKAVRITIEKRENIWK